MASKWCSKRITPSPVVAFQAWVKIGSADEPPELAGIAHVFEHMLFKGTKKRGVGQIAREVESAGGEINAWTSHDETVYHLVLASRFFDTGLDILADTLMNSSFDAGELERERNVVLEEIKQGIDDPERQAGQGLFQTVFDVSTPTAAPSSAARPPCASCAATTSWPSSRRATWPAT